MAESAAFHVVANKGSPEVREAERTVREARTDVDRRRAELEQAKAEAAQAKEALERAEEERDARQAEAEARRAEVAGVRAECHPRLLTAPLAARVPGGGGQPLAAVYAEHAPQKLRSRTGAADCRNPRYEKKIGAQVMQRTEQARGVHGLLCELITARHVDCMSSVLTICNGAALRS